MSGHRPEAARWLAAAAEDLAYARHARQGGFFAPTCFFAQQAAEKAVKAVHYHGGARAVIGHNIRRLITSLELRDARLDECLDAARELDLFYVPARYPNGLEAGTPGEAFSAAQTDRALALAEKILAAAETSVARSA